MIKFEWNNDCDFGNIIYTTGWKNVFFLKDGIIGEPSYQITQEGSEDGFGNFNPIFQKRIKQHKIEFTAPEYLVDAFYDMTIHSNIKITEMDTGVTHNNVSAVVSHEWLTGGCLAVITVLFTSCTTVQKTQCCD